MSTFFDSDRFRALLGASPDRALALLEARHRRQLVLYAQGYTRDEAAAEDAVQETMVHLWQRHVELGRPHLQSIWPYILRVVRNKAITHYKRQRHRATAVVPTEREFPSVHDWLVCAETQAHVRAALAAFPDRERMCMQWRIEEGLTATEMAERLGLKRTVVWRILRKGFQRLRRELGVGFEI
jgi:RNA polymerase sigma-70 factor (ECF subfamily)